MTEATRTDVARVVIVDDDRAIRWVLERALAQPDLEVECIERADTALARLLESPPDVLVTDIRMPGIDGLDLMSRVREAHPDLPVIVMTAHSDLDSAVASYQGGAFEYLPKPFDVDEALALVRRAVAHARERQRPVSVPAGQVAPASHMQHLELLNASVNMTIKELCKMLFEHVRRRRERSNPRSAPRRRPSWLSRARLPPTATPRSFGPPTPRQTSRSRACRRRCWRTRTSSAYRCKVLVLLSSFVSAPGDGRSALAM